MDRLKRISLISFILFNLLVILSMSLLPLAASTTTVTITPSDDAFVMTYHPNDNYGSEDTLNVDPRSSYLTISYIKFNLSDIPDGAVIVSAKLKLHDSASCSDVEIKVYRVDGGDWDESTITWNNKPTYDEGIAYASFTSGDPGWYEIDVTDLVEGWVNGSYNNYGLVLKPVSGSCCDQFRSKEHPNGNHPQLIVEYVEPNTVTTTVTQTITETQTQTVTETTTIANTTITETQTETITTTQTINNTVYSTVTTTLANTTVTTTYYTTIYETTSPTYGNQTVNYYTDLANQLVPLVMVIGVICTMLSLLLSATKR
ncbi:hypothetical protein DRO64_09375 [Candidatus Bathyarchaeota archaeon]|nr:MAG: hypothetical protein DRO64_09375 [Candidatus Bathyarchaeota archaeon]